MFVTVANGILSLLNSNAWDSIHLLFSFKSNNKQKKMTKDKSKLSSENLLFGMFYANENVHRLNELLIPGYSFSFLFFLLLSVEWIFQSSENIRRTICRRIESFTIIVEVVRIHITTNICVWAKIFELWKKRFPQRHSSIFRATVRALL